MKSAVATTKAPGAIGPYSQGIATDCMVYTSGQLGLTPDGKLPETIEEQARQSLENVKAVLEAAGSSMDKVVKTTVFLKDMNDFAVMNGIYAQYFKEPFPARSAVQVAKLPKDGKVEIEVVAVK
ncbi:MULTISPECIES: RidA family protein [unclassified Pyramidobacter]|uniref:RidA family protein n=1 Tax=unclassified Pyramidobacter TaxID=2632171 RepID=UPI00098F04E0|nr:MULTISPECIES: RidA family protein [unclassified Pyramidobacter]MCI7403405.1 RidA family protein [Pyramidobacter sp.]MDY3211594.1 RidA family protein [Pyramidobacter sp.]OON88663.1 reactive intermediate/imine deaminase [Pyramidobacter sp. C12-8]RKJ77826.1 RidA family protein [Pyramidobacter sp. CG50-2]WOL39916.1 RidA family protein [Pyramidobacter sp. YE332]